MPEKWIKIFIPEYTTDWSVDYEKAGKDLKPGEGRHLAQKPWGVISRVFKLFAGEASSHSGMLERGLDGELYIRETRLGYREIRIPLETYLQKTGYRPFMAGNVWTVKPYFGPIKGAYAPSAGTCANMASVWIGLANRTGWFQNSYMSPTNLYNADMGLVPYQYQNFWAYK